MKTGLYQTQIARIIGVHKSTISREMKRHRDLRGAWPKQAHHLAQRQRVKSVSSLISPPTWSLVRLCLPDDCSPKQISTWLESEHHITVSHESIDQLFLTDKQEEGNLNQHIGNKKQGRKGYASTTHRGRLVEQCVYWPTFCHG